MRLRLATRVATLERALGRKVDEKSTEFGRQVTVWLIRNDEYRRLAQQIFERCCETEDAAARKSFDAVMTREEGECLRRLIEQGEDAVRADSSFRQLEVQNFAASRPKAERTADTRRS